jgi:hypothetical protein
MKGLVDRQLIVGDPMGDPIHDPSYSHNIVCLTGVMLRMERPNSLCFVTAGR